MSNIESIAASQRTWSELQRDAILAGPAAAVRALPEVETTITEEVEGMSDQDTAQAAAEQQSMTQASGQILGLQDNARPARSGAISIVPAKHAGFIVVDGGAGSTEILACATTPEEALTWAAARLKSHQFVPVE